MAGPTLPDIKLLYQLGIDPKTRLPLRFGGTTATSKNDIKRMLRIIDEQNHVNRYKWYNIPCDITGQELERMLYYRGQLCFFYIKETKSFYFMPYALNGTIDAYGRFNTIHPIPFTNGKEEKNHIDKALADFLANKRLKCIYGVKDSEEINENDLETYTVLIHDYTKQLSQTILPRVDLIDSVLEHEAEMIPYMSTALALSTGVMGLRVNDADQSKAAEEASVSTKEAALRGQMYIPIIGTIDFQELSPNQTAKAADYMLAMQSIDNFRLRSLGLSNGGLFEKQAHELQSENDINSSNASQISDDGLAIRQHCCNIINSIWGLDMWVELNDDYQEGEMEMESEEQEPIVDETGEEENDQI